LRSGVPAVAWGAKHTINGFNAAGSHYLKTITVSNIPTGCRGADFTIRAYGDSDNTPLSLFNTNSNISKNFTKCRKKHVKHASFFSIS
jgi:hypothetical protein